MGFPDAKIKTLYAMLCARYAFFGLGVRAFNRLGPESYIRDYRIICLKESADNDLIGKRIPLYCIEPAAKKRSFKKNATSLLRSEEVRNYIKKSANGKLPVIIVYKSSPLMERICKKEGFLLATSPYRYTKPLFEHKIRFRNIARDLDLPLPPYELVSVDKNFSQQFQNIKKTLGTPFLLQLAFGAGGRGNSLITTSHEFAKRLQTIKRIYAREKIGECLLASKLIKGSSPSLTAALTKFGTIRTPLQMQLIDIKETLREVPSTFGLFGGHDFTLSFPSRIERQAGEYVKRLGGHMYEKGYRGIVGFDFLWERETNILYGIEANPRFLGTFPTLFYEEIRQGAPPFILFHILEFLSLAKEEAALVKEMVYAWQTHPARPKIRKSAQIFLRNRLGGKALVTKPLWPGIYQLAKNTITFIKPSYHPLDMVHAKEFLICDGVPKNRALIKKDERFLRIIFNKRILKKDGISLKTGAKRVIQAVYQALSLKPL